MDQHRINERKYASLEAEVDQNRKTRYLIGSKISNQDTESDQKVYRFLFSEKYLSSLQRAVSSKFGLETDFTL